MFSILIQKWSVSKIEKVEDYPSVKTQVNSALKHINVTMTILHTTLPELSKVAKYFLQFYFFSNLSSTFNFSKMKWDWTLFIISTYCKRFWYNFIKLLVTLGSAWHSSIKALNCSISVEISGNHLFNAKIQQAFGVKNYIVCLIYLF